MELTNIVFSALSIGGLGLIFGLGLGYAAKKFAVDVNPLVAEVREALPSANCGACGYAGCDAFAKAVVEGDAKTNGCPVGGQACADAVAKIMGVEVSNLDPTTAFVKCFGDCDKAKEKFIYMGVADCIDASQVQGGGSKTCSFGCLGLGSCVKACMFDAIHVENGIALVDEDKCTSCGLCVVACPKDIIEIMPLASRVRVNCNSQEKGKDTMKACSVGCIGCRKCSKACEYDAFTFTNGLAKIDYDKCVQCGACIDVCPTKAITLHA